MKYIAYKLKLNDLYAVCSMFMHTNTKNIKNYRNVYNSPILNNFLNKITNLIIIFYYGLYYLTLYTGKFLPQFNFCPICPPRYWAI